MATQNTSARADHKEKSHMKSSFIVIATALLGSPAFAQEVEASPRPVAHAANQALEITVGAGYAQGFGDIGSGQRWLTDQTSAGGETTLGVGYRVNPNFMIGLYGSGAKYGTHTRTSDADILMAAAGEQASVH